MPTAVLPGSPSFDSRICLLYYQLKALRLIWRFALDLSSLNLTQKTQSPPHPFRLCLCVLVDMKCDLAAPLSRLSVGGSVVGL